MRECGWERMDWDLRMAVKKPRGLGSLREISSGSQKNIPYLFPVLLRITRSGESERRRGEREMEERESEKEEDKAAREVRNLKLQQRRAACSQILCCSFFLGGF